jgi:hypothetical protein
VLKNAILALVVAAAAALPVHAQEQEHSSKTVSMVTDGRYEYRDKELTASLVLRADHTFEYKVDALGTAVGDEKPLHMLTRGIWRPAEFGNIALTNVPTSPPVLRQTSAVIDPKVRAAFTIVTTDGRPVEDLGVRTNDGDDGQLHMMSGHEWTVPLHQEWDTDGGKKGSPTPLPRNWEIVRSADNLSLTKITFSPTGPNRFAFRYTPSPVEPFMLAAGPVKGEPDMIEVELGTASLKMRKVLK